jgi:hypothetical protein
MLFIGMINLVPLGFARLFIHFGLRSRTYIKPLESVVDDSLFCL